MPNRREFLQAGFAASVLPLAVSRPHEAAARSSDLGRKALSMSALYKVVTDLRFADSVAFGREAAQLGARVVEIRGDITDFWFHDLALAWEAKPVAVAGLTAEGPLFCLERLGWDHGLRVVYRGCHQRLEDGRVEHALSGPAAAMALARGLHLEREDWARGVARLVAGCSIESRATETAGLSGVSLDPTLARDEPLVSWVIAPHPHT